MRVDEVREKNNEELQQEMDESYRELMNLRFRWATHQLTNVNEMKIECSRYKKEKEWF